jgi:hypothetical protein
MVTDFQAAWTELMARVAEGGEDGKKTSWGQNELLQEMGKIAGEHRIPEDLLEAATRLVGFPRIHANAAETVPATESDSASGPGMETDHRPPTDRGGHDGPARSGSPRDGDSPPGRRKRDRGTRSPQPVG